MANTTTSLTANKNIDYIVKDFNSSTDALITFANVNYGPGTTKNRLWTNFSVDSFSRTWLELVSYVSDVLYFYLDEQATQNYLQTSTIRSSVLDISAQFGFTPASAASSSGDVVFTTTGAGIIPRGLKLASNSGVPFYLTQQINAGGAGDYTGTVLQGLLKSETFVATGLQNEEFTLSGPNVVVDTTNTNPNDVSPGISVSSNTYTLVDGFLRFDGSDTPPVTDSLGDIIGGGGRVFTLHQRPDGTPFVRFGDGIFGRKLVSGEVITINYRSGGGTSGNIAEDSILFQDSVSLLSSVTNPAKFSGGADEQSIEQLRQLIPASLRTLDRAVAESDYSDLIVTSFSEVFDASTEPNTTDPGIDLNIYVIPQGTTITKITDNSLLLSQINSYVDRRKMVTVQFQVLDAFGIDALVSLEVFIKDTASKTTVRNAIQTALTNFFNLTTGSVDGAGIRFAEPILLKDIYSIIEVIDGIDRFEIKRLSYRPRIDDKIQGLTTTYNHSDVTIFPNVTESEWLLAAAGSVDETEDVVLFSNSSSESFTYNSTTGKIVYDFPVDLTGVSPGDKFRNGPGRYEVTTIKTIGDGTGAFETFAVTTVADQQGVKEVTSITTVADVAGSLGGTYFIIYDVAGPVGVWFNVASGNTQPSTGANRHLEVAIATNATANAVALALKLVLDGDSEFVVPVPGSNILTVTHNTKLSVADAADGSVQTNFIFSVTTQGVSPDTLSGTYFDTSDNIGPVRVWFNVDGGSTAPSTPGGGRLLPVAIVSNDPANTVATALKNAMDADSKFSATVVTNKVTVVNSFVGTRTDVIDGVLATGFTFATTQQGAPATTIDGKYFIINTATESVAFWLDVDNDTSPVIPSAGSLGVTRVSPITTITSGEGANAIATKINTAINADSATVTSTVLTDTITVTDDNKAVRVDASAANSGFTVNTTVQGVEDNTNFLIFAVDLEESSVTILPNQPVNIVSPGLNAGGSIRNGDTTYQSFKCFKKFNATATNLASDSITDSGVDLSVKTGTGAVLNARTLIDNMSVFVPMEYATGEFYLVDGAGNIWEIEENDSTTLLTSITAVNDAGITSITAGEYRIVTKLIGSQVVFNGSIFNIQYNSYNSITSIGAQFTQIGTIGDSFQISKVQTNLGDLGVSADLVSFNQSTGLIRLNDSPDLSGISSGNILLDSTGQSFSITAVDNQALPQVIYNNQNTELIIAGSGVGSQYAQGFQVATTDNYAVVTFNLRKSGNILGNLTVKIVGDDGTGLPDITNLIAISRSVNVSSLAEVTTTRTVFTFTTPPLLSSGIQYHVIISGDTAYNGAQQDGVTIYTNAATYTYSAGLIQYTTSVSLSAVLPGHFFQDSNGDYFKILSVNDLSDSLNVDPSSVVVPTGNGHVRAFDEVFVSVDDLAPTFSSGELAQFNGSVWSNSTLGPDQFSSTTDAVFSVEGPKSIKIESNLTPVLGSGATITRRYYDDNNEISLALGISSGIIVSAIDANPLGKGTVAAIPDSTLDHFIFRTSNYADDIVNLRQMEIPELSLSDIELTILGGIT